METNYWLLNQRECVLERKFDENIFPKKEIFYFLFFILLKFLHILSHFFLLSIQRNFCVRALKRTMLMVCQAVKLEGNCLTPITLFISMYFILINFMQYGNLKFYVGNFMQYGNFALLLIFLLLLLKFLLILFLLARKFLTLLLLATDLKGMCPFIFYFLFFIFLNFSISFHISFFYLLKEIFAFAP